MTEDPHRNELLRLIWQQGLQQEPTLTLSDGSRAEVIRTGNLREGSADHLPDFTEAGIRFVETGTELFGGIKIDRRSSDWQRGKAAPGPDSVILHVVEQRDTVLLRGGRELLSWQVGVPESIETLYARLRSGGGDCPAYLADQNGLTREQLLARVMTDRLRRKSDEVLALRQSLGGDWNEIAYLCLMRSLGMGDRKHSYEALARHTPYRHIVHCQGDVKQIEALLLGQAGLLRVASPDLYTRELQDIFLHLQREFSLKNPIVHWSDGASRPASMPPFLLAQMACMLAREGNYFRRILEIVENEQSGTPQIEAALRSLFRAESSPYWRQRYEVSAFSAEKIDLRIINFVIPLLLAYGRTTRNDRLTELALELYEAIPPENNRYTRLWASSGYKPANAFYSQALIQLSTEYCAPGRCAACPVGARRLVHAARRAGK